MHTTFSKRGFKVKLFAVLCMLLLSLGAFAGSSLPLKLAHEAGFTACDAAIADAFQLVDGNVVVKAHRFAETKGDSIKLFVTSGIAGDGIYSEAEFRKVGSKCLWTKTVILTSRKSCMAYKEGMPNFKFVESSGDFNWTENPGGADMILKGIDTGCMAIFNIGQER